MKAKFIVAVALVLLSFSGCSGDKFSKKLIVSNLHLPYTANVDFIISDKDGSTSGKAFITKADVTTLTFSEPLTYEGVSIKSDETGNADIFSFELSGIPASVPKSMAGNVSLIFSLFSDTLADRIDSCQNEEFRLSGKTNEAGNELAEVFFTENGLGYVISYDRYSGIPYSLDAGNDEISVSIVLKDFSNTQNTKDKK